MLSTIREEFEKRQVLKTLEEYVKIPNQSPTFDFNILTNGHQEAAMKILVDWVNAQSIQGLKLEVLQLAECTPLIFIEIASTSPEAGDVLLYGHFDKQPPLFEGGWMEGTGPYTPKVIDGKLYGRGGADDGYAIFASILSVAALQKQGKFHPRVFIMIEGSEESGSPDLPKYMASLKEKLMQVKLVVCLDSGSGNYEQLWVTSSLRGILVGDLTIKVLTEGVHSGDASGVVPSSFRIARELLARIEDGKTGSILIPELHASREEQEMFFPAAKEAGNVLGEEGMVSLFPFLCEPALRDCGDLALERWWKPQLEVIGASGFPTPEAAGNVLRPSTTLTLSIRLPPTVDKQKAGDALTRVLTTNIPYNAKVEFKLRKASQGWCAPPCAPWLAKSLQATSERNFNGKPAVFQGEGGSIPFMAMLGAMLPQANFFVCGVLGPASNAHGPNECVADVLHDACASETDSTLRPTKALKLTTSLEEEYNRNPDGTKI